MTTSPAPAVGRLASVSLDCPDPSALADFYGALLGLPRAYESPNGASCHCPTAAWPSR
jgi:hypothetical protein